MGGFGQAIIFVMSLVASTLIGTVVVSYVSHSFLVVVESTAAGMDEIGWPDEPFLDWLWKPVYLFMILSFWGTIGWLLLLLIDSDLASTLPGIAGALLVDLWIFFPISLFSSLSAHSLMALLYWPLLRRLVRRIAELFLVYILTVPLIAAGVCLLYLSVTGSPWMLLVAGMLLPPVLFVHARILGRLAWLLASRTPLKKKKPRKNSNPLKKLKVEVVDPWNIPERDLESDDDTPVEIEAASGEASGEAEFEDEEKWGVPHKPYGVMTVEQARNSWQQREGESPPEPGYDVSQTDMPSGAEATLPPRPPEPILLEERLRIANKPPPPPRFVFWSGILSFPFYSRSRLPWFRLAILTTIGLFFVRLMVNMAP